MNLRLGVATLGLALTLASCSPAATSSVPVGQAGSDQMTVGHSTPSEIYDSVESAIRASDGVVLGTVVSITPGRSVTAGGITIPFTNVSLKVSESSVSAISVNSIIVLEQTGGQTANGPLVTEDDPPYQLNEFSLLVLRRIPQGFRSISPLGRFRVQVGRLQPTAPTTAAKAWAGRPMTELMTWAKQAQAGK